MFWLLWLVVVLGVRVGLVSPFIVGGCIGPKSSFERYLTGGEKKELKRIVHENFDGTNQAEVLSEVYHFVHSHVTETQWEEIYPEIEKYRQQSHECSVYAQLLPSQMYKQLLTSVYRASETGADKHEVKRLVEEYIERLLTEGALDRITTEVPALKPAIPVLSPVIRRVSQVTKPAMSPTPFESTTTRTTAQTTTTAAVPVRPAHHYLVMAPPPPVRITLKPPLSINLLLSSTPPTTTTSAPVVTPFAGLSKAMEETKRARFESLARQFLRERTRITEEAEEKEMPPLVYSSGALPVAPASMPPPLYTLFPRAIPVALGGYQQHRPSYPIPSQSSSPYGSNVERLSSDPTFPLFSMNPYYHCPSADPDCCHYCHQPAYWNRVHRRPPLMYVEPWDDRRVFGKSKEFLPRRRTGELRNYPMYDQDQKSNQTARNEPFSVKTTEKTKIAQKSGEIPRKSFEIRREIEKIPEKSREKPEPDGWDVVSGETKEK